MRHLLSLFLILLLVSTCVSCGNVFIGGSLQPGFSTITGVISGVQVSNVVGGDGTFIQVTFVTFFQSGTSSTIGFCGDQSSQFPMNQTVKTNFTPGPSCDTILLIVIII